MSESEVNDREMFRLMQIVEGKDPDAQQIVKDFMKMDNVIERTNLPTTNTVLCVAQLEVASGWLYPDNKTNPFERMKNALALSYMARKGEKANQFVDIFRQNQVITDLQSSVQESKGIISRLTGGKTE